MRISSAAFANQRPIPAEYTCEGANFSPTLAWENVPAETKSFALIMDDPDAPAGTWVHWVLYNIPAGKRSLSAHIPAVEDLPDGAQQGKNSFQRIGYGGPCPPSGHGPHRYFFRIYALDALLDLQSRSSRAQLESAMKGHILDRAELTGHYERQRVKVKSF